MTFWTDTVEGSSPFKDRSSLITFTDAMQQIYEGRLTLDDRGHSLKYCLLQISVLRF